MIAQLINGELVPLNGSDVVFADGVRASYATVLQWTEDELNARDLYVVDDPPPGPPRRRLIAKSVVQERVNDIGKLDAVLDLLNSSAIFFARWFAPNWPNVYFDDPDMLLMLYAVGCTAQEVETITAP